METIVLAQVQAVPAGISPIISPIRVNPKQVPEPSISLVAFLLIGIVILFNKKTKQA